jgi:hypothetical protein
MIKFKEHDGLIFKMLDKPVPLTPDAEMPCLSNHSIIRFSAIDTQTRELVEGLLDAQKEEE